MSNWDEMDQKILVSMSEIGIPEEEVERITPWNRATRKIIWGMILNLFTVAFYGLDLIIPFIGDILLTLGLRSLKKTNKGFRRAYALAWIHLSLRLVSIAGSATPIYEEEYIGILQVVLITAAFIALLVTLKQGIDQVIDSRVCETKNPINGLISWYVVLLMIAVTGLGGLWPVIIALIVAMVVIVGKTLKFGKTLDDYGYEVVPSIIRVSGKVLGTILVAIALVIIVVFTVLFGKVDMNYEETTLEIGQQQTREMLIQKGFPKKVIADMKDDEVEGFADVEKVETQAAYSNGPGWDMEQILVLCEKKDGNVVGVAWFKDKQGRVLSVTDGLVLDPYVPLQNLRGRILYNQDGKSFSSRPIDNQISTTTDYGVKAKFSLPSKKIKARGYICFESEAKLKELNQFAVVVNYYKGDWLPFPYKDVFDDADNQMNLRLPIQNYGRIV